MNKKHFFTGVLTVVVLTAWGMPSISQAQASSFLLTQQVRNLTKQNFAWANSVAANAGDRVEFQVVVTWEGSAPTENVLVRQALAEQLSYAGNLKLNGTPISGNVTTQNINIGTLGASQSKAVTFEAIVATADQLAAGTSSLVNTTTAFNAQGAVSTTALVEATREGKPTDVPTGPLSMWIIGVAVLALVAGAIGAYMFLRSYLKREVLESAYNTRAERKLDTLVAGIQKQERKKAL